MTHDEKPKKEITITRLWELYCKLNAVDISAVISAAIKDAMMQTKEPDEEQAGPR